MIRRYQHVRIDAVHYCELEIELSSKRKKGAFVDHHGKSIDVTQMRLLLFMRTVRESPQLGNKVLSLRMPYMTREASKTDLARTISVLPNLRYVDLPVGFFSDDVSSFPLKQELMARCPDIRRMAYTHGSEASFARIPRTGVWPNLEILELSDLRVEESTLRLVLFSLQSLRSLKLDRMHWIGDSLFTPSQSLPPFPPLQRLALFETPNITASGLARYISAPRTGDVLTELVLSRTGVHPASLYQFLPQASRLQHFTIEAQVDRSFPPENIPPLASKSIKTMHYEITSSNTSPGVQPASSSYYSYLITSLLSNCLPALRSLYVLDASFPDALLFTPPPLQPFANGYSNSRPVAQGLQQPLDLYSKSIDELEWNFTQFDATAFGRRRCSVTRPASFHEAQLGSRWGGESRESILVGNGFGGYLAVPVDEGRPKSSSGRIDLFR